MFGLIIWEGFFCHFHGYCLCLPFAYAAQSGKAPVSPVWLSQTLEGLHCQSNVDNVMWAEGSNGMNDG